MPFELSKSLTNTGGLSFASKGMNGLFASRFYTTAILTIMIIILIMILYPGQKNTPIWILVKLGFYIFLVSLGLIFIHDCVVYHEYEKKNNADSSALFIDGLDSGENISFSGTNDKIKVAPKVNSEVDSEVDSENNLKKGGDEMVGFGECSGVGSNIVGGNADALFELYGV
jgi:hypothetical protein